MTNAIYGTLGWQTLCGPLGLPRVLSCRQGQVETGRNEFSLLNCMLSPHYMLDAGCCLGVDGGGAGGKAPDWELFRSGSLVWFCC